MKKFLAAGLLYFVTTTVYAFEVQLSGADATGILDLDIGDTFYDVMFNFVSGPHTSPGTTDIFASPVANESGAATAVAEIVAALNTSIAITVGNGGQSFIVPYLYNDATCNTLCAKRGSTGFVMGSWAGPTQADIGHNTGIYFAQFTPADTMRTPVPPAIYMFLSGIAVLGWFRRRKPV
jgi:hypothetical protein